MLHRVLCCDRGEGCERTLELVGLVSGGELDSDACGSLGLWGSKIPIRHRNQSFRALQGPG